MNWTPLIPNTHTHTVCILTNAHTAQALLIYQVWLVAASQFALDLQPKKALHVHASVCVIESVFVSCPDSLERKEVVKRGNEM